MEDLPNQYFFIPRGATCIRLSTNEAEDPKRILRMKRSVTRSGRVSCETTPDSYTRSRGGDRRCVRFSNKARGQRLLLRGCSVMPTYRDDAHTQKAQACRISKNLRNADYYVPSVEQVRREVKGESDVTRSYLHRTRQAQNVVTYL